MSDGPSLWDQLPAEVPAYGEFGSKLAYPCDVANDAERLARFQREAEVLASLNHPHIAHVYGIEDNSLIMELVEGEDLSQRIARGSR